MKKLSNKYIFLFTFFLVSCATIYQEEGFFSNGYSTRSLTPNTFVITFKANEFTDPDDVIRLALCRCHQVAFTHGYCYFIIDEQLDHESKRRVPGLTYPSVQLTISCFHEKPLHMDAIEVLKAFSS